MILQNAEVLIQKGSRTHALKPAFRLQMRSGDGGGHSALGRNGLGLGLDQGLHGGEQGQPAGQPDDGPEGCRTGRRHADLLQRAPAGDELLHQRSQEAL